MKAVIFAGGKGTRMGATSAHTPKPMLKVLGKNLLQHKIDALPPEIFEVIIVIGHLGSVITDFFGTEYNGKKITYVLQEEQKGTAHCLSLCKDHLFNEGRFLVLMGDDIYSKTDMEECLKHDYSILVTEQPNIKGKAKIICDESGHIVEISEKWHIDEPGYVNTGMYSLTPKIFAQDMVAISDTEFGLPQTILTMKDKVDIKAIKSSFWFQISSPEDIRGAEEFLLMNIS